MSNRSIRQLNEEIERTETERADAQARMQAAIREIRTLEGRQAAGSAEAAGDLADQLEAARRARDFASRALNERARSLNLLKIELESKQRKANSMRYAIARWEAREADLIKQAEETERQAGTFRTGAHAARTNAENVRADLAALEGAEAEPAAV